MTIIEALIGEHGALCALFDRIEALAQNAELPDLKLHAGLIESTVISHADLEDELLRPEIQRYLPLTAGPTHHEQIRAGLRQVGAAVSADEARRCLPENIGANARAFSEGRSIGFV